MTSGGAAEQDHQLSASVSKNDGAGVGLGRRFGRAGFGWLRLRRRLGRLAEVVLGATALRPSAGASRPGQARVPASASAPAARRPRFPASRESASLRCRSASSCVAQLEQPLLLVDVVLQRALICVRPRAPLAARGARRIPPAPSRRHELQAARVLAAAPRRASRRSAARTSPAASPAATPAIVAQASARAGSRRRATR